MNKVELLAFVTSKVAEFSFICHISGQVVVFTGDGGRAYRVTASTCKTVITTRRIQDCGYRTACTEATRGIIHERTVDTFVIIAGTFHDLLAMQPLADIWVAFGTGKDYSL